LLNRVSSKPGCRPLPLSARQTIFNITGDLLADRGQFKKFFLDEGIFRLLAKLPINRRLLPQIVIPVHARSCPSWRKWFVCVRRVGDEALDGRPRRGKNRLGTAIEMRRTKLREIAAMGQRLFLVLAGAALLWLATTHARADVIDGDWCNADGKRMKIRGPEIVTPGGTQTRGNYTRHSFVYVVPAGEAGAGETVSIILLSEYLAHARQGPADAPIKVWNRCPPGVADARPSDGSERG
jgi:hypothetical protein